MHQVHPKNRENAYLTENDQHANPRLRQQNESIGLKGIDSVGEELKRNGLERSEPNEMQSSQLRAVFRKAWYLMISSLSHAFLLSRTSNPWLPFFHISSQELDFGLCKIPRREPFSPLRTCTLFVIS